MELPRHAALTALHSIPRSLLRLIVLVFLLLPLLLVVRVMYDEYVERNWSRLRTEDERSITEEITSQFSRYQAECLHHATEFSRNAEFIAALSSVGESRTKVFELLLSNEEPTFSVVAYDRDRNLVGWSGPRGDTIELNRLSDRPTSFLQHGPIYSYLLVAVPVYADRAQFVGYVVASRLFDVNYPINNRFVQSAAVTSAFSRQLRYDVRFTYSPASEPSHAANTFSIPLRGVGGAPIGYAIIDTPSAQTALARVQVFWAEVISIMFFTAVALIVAAGVLWITSLQSLWIRLTGWTIAIWIVRYALIWFNVPLSQLSVDIFSPTWFASPFGSGLAGSLGDVVLSSALLLLNVTIVVVSLVPRLGHLARRLNVIGGGAIAFALSALFLVLLRGFVAAVRSAIFDSTLTYNDPTAIIPSFELSLMMISLAMLAISLVLVGVLIVLACKNLLLRSGISKPVGFVILLIPFVLTSLVLEFTYSNILINFWGRLAVSAIVVLAALLVNSRREAGRSILHPISALLVFAVSLGVLVPIVDHEAHAYDRSHVELLAGEIARPVDGWLTFVLNRALDELSAPTIAEVVAVNDREAAEKLAFTEWARSILSKEGLNCSVTFVNQEGRILSDFHIGDIPFSYLQPLSELLPSERWINVETLNRPEGIVKWYTGYEPLRTANGVVVGGVWVELSAGKQAILRTSSTDILRNYSREDFERHHRALILSEYFNDLLVSSSDEAIPRDTPVPRDVATRLHSTNGAWTEHSINGTTYETYFFFDQSGTRGGTVYALSMESLGVRWHIYRYLRYAFFYSLVIVVLVILTTIVRYISGIRTRPSVRTKLFGAFVVVSLIPVLVLAYSNRQYALERSQDYSVRRVQNQTMLVSLELQQQVGAMVPATLANVTNGTVMSIASFLSTDFNVYYGPQLRASSRPEMIEAELLDESMSGTAYLNVFLKRRSFFWEAQSIGNYPYIVGYRPLVSEDGSVIGAIAVPTLYRQLEMQEELARRDTFLFGAYGIALLASILAGTLFANQISAPIRRLKAAARQIARGELSVELRPNRSDELGELETTFKEMTDELRQTQAKMMKAERELAWREMAKQVAHEIKNPLTPMKLSLQHLRQAYRDRVKDFDTVFQQVTGTVLEQIETLSRIATEFSRFARMPERRVEVCDVHETLSEAVALFDQRERVHFTVKLHARDCNVRADREELRRAFINILRNAVQAIGDHGRIEIVTASQEGLIDVRISDTGPGIPAEIQERLFEPNFSTKTDGMGLGLAIVKKTIEDVSGSIQIESTLGEGTTVIVQIPTTVRASDVGRHTVDQNPIHG
jgi:two-component system nitrogen regulation sensor histidine kinase NtrY